MMENCSVTCMKIRSHYSRDGRLRTHQQRSADGQVTFGLSNNGGGAFWWKELDLLLLGWRTVAWRVKSGTKQLSKLDTVRYRGARVSDSFERGCRRRKDPCFD